MGPEKQLAGHDDPQVEGRFVGVRRTVGGESEEMPVADRLVGDAEIAQLVGRREIAQNHRGQQRREEETEKPAQRLAHDRCFLPMKRLRT